ncbi:MAG: precorrin-6y C5,15-methyltransferase (decarboxylating) subunit CbiE [Rhodobacteraceae bacterium]|nr:precorrin-6y C5,15-methyltransferase (decarboxylating) subunit CbiE [Paracoccaceae bacterium]
MAETPWLTIIGMGADGVAGLSASSQAALAAAEVILAPPRHLEMVGETTAERLAWPVPFTDGVRILQGLRGRRTVVLASGDPFWFGAGRVIADTFAAGDWVAIPAPSSFSIAAARLGWPLETTLCLGLHAAPIARLRPHLARGVRIIVTLRDGAAVADLTGYLAETGFGDSHVWVMEALGGAEERVTKGTAANLTGDFTHPVLAAIEASDGPALPRTAGLPDAAFDHDGQITKRPMRAVTLSTLAPRPFETLWDIGGGSGSISIEWALSHPTTRAICIESRADRATRIAENARAFGVDDRVQVIEGAAPGALAGLPGPDAVFVGGGLSEDLLESLTAQGGFRLVVNAVTLESEALVAGWQARIGGDLMRLEMASAAPLGPKRGWQAAWPVVQWSVTI